MRSEKEKERPRAQDGQTLSLQLTRKDYQDEDVKRRMSEGERVTDVTPNRKIRHPRPTPEGRTTPQVRKDASPTSRLQSSR